MKNFLFLFACTLLLSCSDDDTAKTGAGLEGAWTMTVYTNSSGTLPVLEYEDVVYDFNLKDNTLTIENNVQDESPQFGASGTYPLAVSPKLVSIDHGEYIQRLQYSFEDSHLVLRAEEGVIGGPYMEFDKIIDLEL